MNIDKINKFKTEFDHILQGGNVKVKYICGGLFSGSITDFDDDMEYCFIDDDYSKYREALCKGEIVEYFVTPLNFWQATTKIFTNIDVKDYRIKPKETADVNSPSYTYKRSPTENELCLFYNSNSEIPVIEPILRFILELL